MALASELEWRGFVNQMTFKSIEEVNQPRTLYWGVDPSADSMQIGNLAAAMMVRQFLEHGHKLVLLVGGATGLIGDPDGKKDERNVKSREQIEANVRGLTAQLSQLFGDADFEVVNNHDWFKNISYLDFLRDVGKHVSMTQMLDREFVQNRIGEGGSGISYAEFSYSLIQGYDFVHLYRERGVTLQLAGADQWGNSLMGVELLRKLDSTEGHVFTTPLIINKQTGLKFGKSEGGAVWLNPEKTSPYKFYQFWLNVDDDMAKDLIKIYTLLGQEEIEAIIENHDANPGARLLQKTLSREVTEIVHGRERRESVERVTGVLFGGADFTSLGEQDIDALSAEIPVVRSGATVIEALVSASACQSNGEARRLLEGGAIVFNGRKLVSDETLSQPGLLRKGKNVFILVKE